MLAAVQRSSSQGGVEEHGGLLRRPAEHVAQNQDGALPGREVLNGDQERELDRLLRDKRRIRLCVTEATGSNSRSGYGCSQGRSAVGSGGTRGSAAAPT